MCIIFFKFTRNCCELSSKYRLILAANRDEHFARPAKGAHFWEDGASILGGRDKTKGREGGAWLAMDKSGKIGTLTNFRHRSDLSGITAHSSLSPRGYLVVNYMKGSDDPAGYIDQVLNGEKKYSPFNLLLGKYSHDVGFSFFYGSNVTRSSIEDYQLQPGIHGLCNAELNCSWTKVQEGKRMFSQIVEDSHSKEDLVERLFQLMKDDTQYYPNHGGSAKFLDEDKARCLSGIFVLAPQIMYGTRATTVILVDKEDHVTFIERSMADPTNLDDPGWQTQRFEFQLDASELSADGIL